MVMSVMSCPFNCPSGCRVGGGVSGVIWQSAHPGEYSSELLEPRARREVFDWTVVLPTWSNEELHGVDV